MTPFSLFPRQIGRISWLCRTIVAIILFLPFARFIAPTSPLGPNVSPWMFEIAGWFAVIAFCVYVIGWIHLPRARSLGLHWASLVLLIIPIANICLLMLFLFGGEGYWSRLSKRNGQSPPA
jgi:hypothetical protein